MRTTRLRIAIATIAALVTLVPATAHSRTRMPHRVTAMKAADCAAGAELVPDVANLAAIRAATLCLLNVERTQRGRPPLRPNVDLSQAASLYARAMVHDGFFAHVSPNGSTLVGRIRRTAYLTRSSGWALGENLAWGDAELGSPAKTVDAWMHSPDHKRNVLDGRYVEIGIGVAYGTPNGGQKAGATYATEFGTRSLMARS